MTIAYSDDQQCALDRIREWIDDPTELELTLGGLAGTGKTTIIKTIVPWKDKTAVVALTGKAAYVLRSKGVACAQTLHSLIYAPQAVCRDCGELPESCTTRNKLISDAKEGLADPAWGEMKPCPSKGRVTRFRLAPAIGTGFVIVDEASMLNARIVRDLRSYRTKILFVGDHGQLEPIGEDPGLMRDPQLRLEQIHRQASGSWIIRMAHDFRRGAPPRMGSAPDGSVIVREGSPSNLATFDAILCGYNKTRVAVNSHIRQQRGFSGLRPEVGERVICLRNDSDYGIFNGMQANVADVRDGTMSVVDDVGNEYVGMPVMWEQFGAEKTLDGDDGDEPRTQWDFGYAMTVHKSQGSEWRKVCVYEQISRNWSSSRWRYTAATRAAEHLTWCMPR